MKWFLFRQNNPGGSMVRTDFLLDKVFVQAAIPRIANVMLEEAGADFEDHCTCCGHRWCPASDDYDVVPCPEVDKYSAQWRDEHPDECKEDEVYAKVIYSDGAVFDLMWSGNLLSTGKSIYA